jgi:RHS repeat-associated protein
MNPFTRSLAQSLMALVTASQANAQERTWSFIYDANAQVTLADGPRTDVNDSFLFTYDQAGNRTSVTNPLGHITRMFNHNNRGQPHRLIDANGIETVLSYHPLGWLLSSSVIAPGGNNASNATTHYKYDNEGLLLTTTLPDGSQLHNEYDASHRLVATSNGKGERIQFFLDAAGNRLTESTHNQAGSLIRRVQKNYDELNRLILITGSAGNTTSFSYDKNGNTSSTVDGNGNTTVFFNDALNRLAGSNAAYAHNISYGHDQRGNLELVLDPLGLATRYHYNAFDELQILESPDTGTTYYSYDAAGNRTTTTDANGNTKSVAYDALNRPTYIGHPNPELDIRLGYDTGNFGKGRLTSISDRSGITLLDYDHRGNRIHQHIDTGEQQFSFSYNHNLADRLTSITYPSGRLVEYSYDAAGRISSIRTTGSEGIRDIATDLEYLAFGPTQTMNYGNGIQMLASFDLDYRMLSLAHGNALNRTYSHDNANNVLSIEDGRDSNLGQTFNYDALNRLGAATGSYGSIAYSYDANSNRLSYSDANGVDSYTYDTASNRLLSTSEWDYGYDENGNLIAKINRSGTSDDGFHYRYDERNRLSQAIQLSTVNGEHSETVIANYIYNALGQRARNESANGSINYLYGPQGRLLAEVNQAGVTLREYIYLDDRPVAVVQAIFTDTPAPPGQETVIDDTDAAISTNGNWEQVRKKGAYGDYYHRSENAGAHYRWNLENLNASDYEVYAWWPKAKKNNRNARYSIVHAGQVSASIQNQGSLGKRWVYLGTYKFSGESDEYIELSDEGGTTAADGIRLVEIPAPPPPLISKEIFYIHGDHLGTPQAITDQSRNVVWRADYKPFGHAQIDVADIASNLRFPGQYYDSESGLHQNFFRDYDPYTGRYIQPDPIGLKGGSNTFIYALQSPSNYYDPDGLEVVVHSRPVKGIGPAASHTFTTVTLPNGKSTTISSHNDSGYNIVSLNHPSDSPNGDNVTDSVLIPVPKGMTPIQFDNAVLDQADLMINQPPFKYHLFPKVFERFSQSTGLGNCHTTTSKLITGAGGKIPPSYNPVGFNPGLH